MIIRNFRNNVVILKVWIESDENLWYQAANPQHITTNNGVEGLNQSFKKHFTGRTRQSFPSMFNLLKELVQTWARTNQRYSFDPKRVPNKMILKAEAMRNMMHTEDKTNCLLLSKKVKDTHKTMVTKDYGAIRGHVVSTSVMPIKDDLLKSSRADFAVTGQEIHRRRNTTNYETFDSFMEDLKSVVYVEAIFMDEQRQGDYFLACSCVNEKSESGVKGKLCVHSVVVMLETGIIKKNVNISNFSNRKGAAKKNQKQTS